MKPLTEKDIDEIFYIKENIPSNRIVVDLKNIVSAREGLKREFGWTAGNNFRGSFSCEEILKKIDKWFDIEKED